MDKKTRRPKKTQKNPKNYVNLEFIDEKKRRKNIQIQCAGSKVEKTADGTKTIDGTRMEITVPYIPNGEVFTMTTDVHIYEAKVSLESEKLKRFLDSEETVFINNIS